MKTLIKHIFLIGIFLSTSSNVLGMNGGKGDLTSFQERMAFWKQQASKDQSKTDSKQAQQPANGSHAVARPKIVAQPKTNQVNGSSAAAPKTKPETKAPAKTTAEVQINPRVYVTALINQHVKINQGSEKLIAGLEAVYISVRQKFSKEDVTILDIVYILCEWLEGNHPNTDFFRVLNNAELALPITNDKTDIRTILKKAVACYKEESDKKEEGFEREEDEE